jgi:undecaprenyl diphosphate synthase
MKPDRLGEDCYLSRLNMQNIPQHVAVIMDGNGRWAQQRRMPRVLGHRKGADRVREIVETCGKLKIKALTLFAFSEENWQRPSEEVNVIMRLLNVYLEKEKASLHKNNVHLKTIGNLSRLPEANQKLIAECVKHLAGNTGLTLTLALSYGGRSEMVAATKKISEKVAAGDINVEDIDESLVNCFMESSALPPLDLLIRTSGEQRISNFLLWQLAYAELFFTSVLWPDFASEDLYEALVSFQSRQRRYGKVSTKDDPTFTAAAVLEQQRATLL